jgi:Zn-finger nucleic acid-binding protein
VDQRPNCNGYWLDAGELALIRQERAAAEQAKKPQTTAISSSFIRHLYRLEQADRKGAGLG